MNQQVIEGIKISQREIVDTLLEDEYSIEVEISDQYSKYSITITDVGNKMEANLLADIEDMANRYMWIASVEAHEKYNKIVYPCLTIKLVPDMDAIGREHV